MNKLTNVLLTFIVVLLLLNIVLTASLLNNQNNHPNIVNNNRLESLDSTIAQAWGNKVKEMYNLQDHQALYALFDDQAKVKISHQQLQSQLQKLFQLFGEIEQSAFVSSDKIGEKGDQLYYKLLFNIRVEETSSRLATLTLSVITKNNKVSLYGVRINAIHSPE